MGRGGEDGRAHPDHDHAHGEGGQQAHEVGRIYHPVHRDSIYQEAEEQGEYGHRQESQVGINSRMGKQQVSAEHPQGDKGAVTQVDYDHHPKDQGKAHGGQAINEPQE